MIESDLLKSSGGIRHGFFTREGGVSGGIYESLNCGTGSKDNPGDVRENRRLVAERMGAEDGRLLTLHQCHSSEVILVKGPWDTDGRPKADALVTATSGLALGILTADCTPVLFADTESGIIGAAHSGWKGAKAGIIGAVVDQMEELGAHRRNIRAVIGPTISRYSYEVGPEFESAFLDETQANAKYFCRSSEIARPFFDLPLYCEDRLAAAGVAHIENLHLCTYENESLFFSYRRSVHRNEPDYGRQISAILIL